MKNRARVKTKAPKKRAVRVYLFGHRRKHRRKPPPYRPSFMENGKRVYTREIVRTWTREAARIVREVEAALRENANWAWLRRLPYADWNRLLDALPVCECGRPIAPIRAKWCLRAGIVASCCPEHSLRRRRRIKRRIITLYVRRHTRAQEREALAEAIGQA